MSLLGLHSTNVLLSRASACLLDPEQTAVAPGVANYLGALLASLTHLETPPTGARETALHVLDHEHTRITADPTPTEPSSQADLLDMLATSFAHGAVDGMTPASEDAAFRFLIAMRDDVRAGRVL